MYCYIGYDFQSNVVMESRNSFVRVFSSAVGCVCPGPLVGRLAALVNKTKFFNCQNCLKLFR